MLINLRNALMARKRLPYDAEVEYLESTGTQYIDTGVVGRFDTVVELDNEMTREQTTRGVFGSYSGANAHRSLFLYVTANGPLQIGAAGNAGSPYLPFDTDRHLWQWTGNIVYKDGVEVFRSPRRPLYKHCFWAICTTHPAACIILRIKRYIGVASGMSATSSLFESARQARCTTA